jgi:hypothetical protein
VSFRWTTTELAFAVPGGVVVGAAIALGGVIATNRANQRRIFTEKSWEKRAELYVDLIRLLLAIEKNFFGPLGTSFNYGVPVKDRAVKHLRKLLSLRPRVSAYASTDVRKRLNEWMIPVLYREGLPIYDLIQPNEPLKERERRLNLFRVRASSLRELMGAELQGTKSRSGSLRASWRRRFHELRDGRTIRRKG